MLALTALLLLAAWAPVPAVWQLTFRIALLGTLYIVMVAQIWRNAVASFDCGDEHISPRCREELRRYDERRDARRRLTPVRQNYLAALARAHIPQKDR